LKPLKELIDLNENFFCEWTGVTDDPVGLKYSTKCGNTVFEFETKPHVSWKFCPFCGKMLKP